MYVIKKRKKPRTKKDNQFWHAKKRAFERYEIVLTRSEHDYLISRVRKGKVQLLEKQSNRIRVCMGELNGQKVKFVYDRTRKSIVSFLPLTEDEKKEKFKLISKTAQEKENAQKVEDQFAHAQLYAAKIYGITFTHQMGCDLIAQAEQQPMKRERVTDNVKIYEGTAEGKPVRFMYHRKNKIVVTFLPLEEEEKT